MSRRTKDLSWAIRLDGRALWTLNADPKQQVYGESLRRFKGEEWRRWEPHRSKLGAALLRCKIAQEELLPEPGSTILYLGAGHGTSVSHLHDHLCGNNNEKGGRLVAVDLSPRCLRDLTHLARSRKGLVPVLGDARKLETWGVLVPKRVNWLFQDVAQAGQVSIFLAACDRFLAEGGIGLLSLKAASERAGEGSIFDAAENELIINGREVIERIDLKGYEDQHVVFLIR